MNLFQIDLPEKKKDSNQRMILNFKKSKSFVNYEHSKMESINVIYPMQPNVYIRHLLI